MKKCFVWIALAVVVGGTGCGDDNSTEPGTPSGALVRWQSVGWKAVSGREDVNTLREVAALPASGVLLNLVLDKLAATPARLWADALPADATDHAGFIRPLLRDTIDLPSRLLVKGTTGQPVAVLAVRADGERARQWSTNLWQLAERWQFGKPLTVNEENGGGWRVTLPERGGILGLREESGWVLLYAGRNVDAAVADMLGELRDDPDDDAGALWEVEVDWPRLGSWVRYAREYPILAMTMKVLADGDKLRTEAGFQGKKPMDLEWGAWQIPTNFMSEPLVSLTALRGVRPLLSPMPVVRELGLDPVPNQLFLWGQKLFNGQTMIAIPATNALEQMDHLAQSIPETLGAWLDTKLPGQIYWLSNKAELVWRRMPVVVPFAKAISTNSDSLLVAGLFPFVNRETPPPGELFEQFKGSEDILYYDWEVTEERLIHYRHYYQMADIFSKRETMAETTPEFVWMQSIFKMLGNSVTEMRLAQPDTLRLVRRSHIGLTGYEIVTLMRWIHSAGFPLTFEQQPKKVLPERVRKKLEESRSPSETDPQP